MVVGDGNFRALLAFRVDAGDEKLREHLASAGRNATYISKTSQNEFIDICGDLIAEQIVAEACRAEYFTVLCDETTDTGHHEQLCVCIRFVSKSNGYHMIKEEFLQFQRAERLTGAALAKQILCILRSHKLNISKLVGQGYDGAAAMAGHINGVQANIKLEAPLAEYVHCSSHVLNLVLNAASAVPEIRDMFGTVREVTKFLNESAKRRIIVAESLGEEGGRSLVTMCETRFVERHDAILVFHKQLKYTLDALEKIAQGMTDRKAADRHCTKPRQSTDCFHFHCGSVVC